MFSSMFGNNFGGFGFNGFQHGQQGGRQQHGQQGQQQRISKNRDTIFQLTISLKDSFLGKIKKLKITKKIIIDITTKKHITEKLETTWEKCPKCFGRGMLNETREVGPGMFAQTQRACSSCAGKGCELSKEYSIEEISEIIEINIPKGVNNEHHIRMSNQGNVIPGTYPGDLLIIILVPNNENGFQRNGNNLHIKREILLSEALCGSSIKIKTLDERELYVSFTSVIPKEQKIIKNEGINGGDLIINFDIIFPSSTSSSSSSQLSKEKKKEIKKLLPVPKEKVVKNKDDVCYTI